MVRAACCEKVGLKKGKWTAEEDELLVKYIQANGEGSWRSLPKNAGLLRCGKSCRLRWTNYLRPDLKRGKFTADEDETIVKLHSSLGNRWSLIANHFPGRTDNEIKNYWISNLRRRLYNFRHKGIIKNTIEVSKMAVVGDENCECSRKRDRVSQSKSKKYKNNMAAYESTCHGGCGGATWSESGSNESLLPKNYTIDTEFLISPLTEGKGLETQQHEHHLDSEISELRKEEAEDNKKKDINITLEKQEVCNGMLEEQQNECLHDFENWCDMNFDYFLEEQKWVDQYSSSLNLEFGSIEDCIYWDDSLLWLWND